MKKKKGYVYDIIYDSKCDKALLQGKHRLITVIRIYNVRT